MAFSWLSWPYEATSIPTSCEAGAKEVRCPWGQGDIFHDALSAMERPIRFIRMLEVQDRGVPESFFWTSRPLRAPRRGFWQVHGANPLW